MMPLYVGAIVAVVASEHSLLVAPGIRAGCGKTNSMANPPRDRRAASVTTDGRPDMQRVARQLPNSRSSRGR
jgi:hypothetical protein